MQGKVAIPSVLRTGVGPGFLMSGRPRGLVIVLRC
jgi:hypothetical protein